MTCKEFVEFLWQYLEAELSESQRRTFDEHLADCPDCVSYLDSYRATVRLARAAQADDRAELPGDVPEELVRAILEARRK